MDLLKLFALLVAVTIARISAEGPKKKIRIHLPQKVKHIHHHKKIYITNHPASSQYAPAYVPSAEGAMALPTALPSVGGLLPISSEMYEESAQRAPASSKLLPLYHARGYYGPNPTEWDDQEYDLSPPPEFDPSYPTAFSGPSAPLHYPQKKAKILKLNEPKKKAVRKGKPKRVKQQLEEEIPVSSFHEQFYSDLDGSATLKKVKKPHRVEKIVDGDTEHIHTYSEEHIHKLVYDDGSARLIGANPAGSMSALSPSHYILPIKSSLLALSPDVMTGYTPMGSMRTPSHLEYAAYNTHDVTHDHVFHDHGEIPPDADVAKENLPYSSRVSYDGLGIRADGHGSKGYRSKFPYSKPTKPTNVNDYSYYENMYSSYARPRVPRPTNPSALYTPTTEATLEHYRPIPSYKFKDKANIRSRHLPAQASLLNFGGNQNPDYTQQISVPSPFAAVSSTVVHDYKPKTYPNQASGAFEFSNYRDPLQNFKDSDYKSNLDLDSFASASLNLYSSDDKFNPSISYPDKRGKKKSISTQNIRIGSLDHQTTVDHLGDSGLSTFLNNGVPSALDFGQSKPLDSATSTPYTIRESSLVHPYYTAMAAKALNSRDPTQGEASNTNFQYVEAPTTEFTLVATTNVPHDYFELENTEIVPTESAEVFIETTPKHNTKDVKINVLKDTRQRHLDGPSHKPHRKRLSNSRGTEPSGKTWSRQYGDKI